MRPLPSFSAVVEWENARLTGAERATRMLRALVAQTRDLLGELEERPELIILYEKGVIAPEVIETSLSRACRSEVPLELRFHATEGSNYYGQKNEGAELASRDYVLFLDSDVVPEPGWLRAMLGSLRGGVEVVGGGTYVETGSFLGRAFGLFWFFPLRAPSKGLREANFFYANNVIFRRELFLAHKFPDLPLYRGHCAILANRLHKHGVRLYLQTDAIVAHPPPNPKHFAHRAVSEGYDLTIRRRLLGQPAPLGREELRLQLGRMRTRIDKRLGQIKVGRGEAAAARILAGTYCLLRFAGQQWAARSPEQAQRMLGIRTFCLPSATDVSQPHRQS